MKKFLLVIGAVFLAVWYLNQPPKNAVPESAGAAMSPGPGCLMAAASANSALADATRLLRSMPVDSSKWSDAESRVSSAISSAELACSGGTADAERAGMEDVRDALSLMRLTLSEGGKAAAGAGSFQGAIRQEAIDNRLSSARSKIGLR